MSNPIELSVILPAYLEEENLRILLPRLVNVLEQFGVLYEVVVVDTQTPMDHTKQVCEENGVRYIARKQGNTFGDAVRTGIESSYGTYVIFMDSDGSHEPEFIGDLYQYRHEYDVVVASRYIKGGVTENSLVLILMSQLLNVIYSFILNIKCKDVSNSFKLYPGDVLRSLKLQCNNFDIVEEVLYKLSRKIPNMRIKEVPFVFRKRMFGNTKRNLFIFILTYIYSIIRLRFFCEKEPKK